jgi:pilus assembly protein Flp/PilA
MPGLSGYSKFFSRLLVEDEGQDLIEYALVAALIGLGAITSMKGLATKISTTFNGIGTSLTSSV